MKNLLLSEAINDQFDTFVAERQKKKYSPLFCCFQNNA